MVILELLAGMTILGVTKYRGNKRADFADVTGR